MTSYHNPALVSDAQVGQRHRLLSTEDLDKPLPEGAEYWMPVTKQWCKSGCAERKWSADLGKTYRIPLTPVDRLRQEIAKRLENEGWSEADIQELKEWFESKQPLPPAPSSIPWTLETRPLTDVWVKAKADDGIEGECQVVRWTDEGAYTWGQFIPYSELHSDWLQRNGQPAGQEVQG